MAGQESSSPSGSIAISSAWLRWPRCTGVSIDTAISAAQPHIVQAEARHHEAGRHHKAWPCAGIDPHADAVTDEVVAEIGDLRIGHHAAFLDARIDQRDLAGGTFARAKLCRIEPDRIAELERDARAVPACASAA